MPETGTVLRRKKPRHRSAPTAGREFRRFAATGLEIRSAGGDGLTITGMPIVYNSAYRVMDWLGEFEETMAPGVASHVLAANPDVRFLFNHDGLPLARTISGTLTLQDTGDGLRMSATLDSRQQLANDLAVAIERGDVSQMSCGFVVGLDEWNDAGDERTIYRFSELFDVSAVTYPASPTTSIELGLRSMLAMPIESRARVRLAWKAAHEARAGKVLSAENATLLQNALDALHEADDVDIPNIISSLQTIDDALDAGQEGLSSVLNKANPDDDDEQRDDSNSDAPSNADGTTSVEDNATSTADATGSRSTDDPDAETRDETVEVETRDETPADVAPKRNVALELEAEQLRLHGRKHIA